MRQEINFPFDEMSLETYLDGKGRRFSSFSVTGFAIIEGDVDLDYGCVDDFEIRSIFLDAYDRENRQTGQFEITRDHEMYNKFIAAFDLEKTRIEDALMSAAEGNGHSFRNVDAERNADYRASVL